MNAVAIIDRARADGVTLALDPAGKLKATGEQAAVARWLPKVREHKPALVSLFSEPRRLWLVVLPTGERFSSSFTPPATLADVHACYPDAQVEPDGEPAPAHVTCVDSGHLLAHVTCGTCRHWRRDRVGDGFGLGTCTIGAPASRRPGACWAGSTLTCKDHREGTA